jgi:hypothetical protein
MDMLLSRKKQRTSTLTELVPCSGLLSLGLSYYMVTVKFSATKKEVPRIFAES